MCACGNGTLLLWIASIPTVIGNGAKALATLSGNSGRTYFFIAVQRIGSFQLKPFSLSIIPDR